jgi:hypothetical protein
LLRCLCSDLVRLTVLLTIIGFPLTFFLSSGTVSVHSVRRRLAPVSKVSFCVVLVCASSNAILLASVSICRIRSPSHTSVLTQGKHLRHQILHNQIACCSANGVERNSGLHDSETHHILVIRCDSTTCLTELELGYLRNERSRLSTLSVTKQPLRSKRCYIKFA